MQTICMKTESMVETDKGVDDEAEDEAHEERQAFNCHEKGAAKKGTQKYGSRPG
jgi:hypothetical protein